ncbi:uncharacterized protein EV420DRAFT_820352 [Desarmillaria tabescens]|uniref:Uncharacterized protein n=1 Tax=Armillaria tabescens TaxID=1929756 RepID=A0AA39T5Q0_ARMTA|nr:uncharacterized protein EV420DRAFT_820352 [Desarmillaria tabescens]KAK0466286.1 hypothetical protein EV420DRAFT_820352 [Desarmillaria tabescens]
MDQRVPQEILDAVVDLLKDDKPALKALSLISRCFTPRTRVHLFYSITPGEAQWNEGMLDLLRSSPSLIVHIRRLRFLYLCSYDSALIAIIELLVNPIHLVISWRKWGDLPEQFLQALHSRAYASIVLSDSKFTSFSELASLLANSTHLERLAVYKYEPCFRDTDPSSCTHQHPSPGPPVDHLILFDLDGCLYHLLSGYSFTSMPGIH